VAEFPTVLDEQRVCGARDCVRKIPPAERPAAARMGASEPGGEGAGARDGGRGKDAGVHGGRAVVVGDGV